MGRAYLITTVQPDNVFEMILASGLVDTLCKFWYAFLAVGMILPTFGPERIWFLSGPPLFLLVINAYLLLLMFLQTKKEIMDRKSLAVPKFLLYAVNSFFTFAIVPVAALVFIPGALQEFGATMILPFTTASLTLSLALFVCALLSTAFGALLVIKQGRKMWNNINQSELR